MQSDSRRPWRIYVSARSDVRNGGELMYKGTWTRLTRRMIRDCNFRGWSPEVTFRIWANVRRGELKYISPYKSKADFLIDTALGYEIPALRSLALPCFRGMPQDVERAAELRQVADLLERFPDIPAEWVPPDSILREFIG